MEKKIAYVDVCNTLVNFYTLGDFINYVLNKNKNISFRIKKNVYRIVNKLVNIFNISFPNSKRIYFLKGLNLEELEMISEEYFKERILPNLNLKIISKVKELNSAGYEIILVTAALLNYVTYFKNLFNVSKIFATELECINKNCTGKVLGEEIYGEQKLLEIIKFQQNYSHVNSISISDHISDLPMLLFTNDSICVNPNNKLEKIAINMNWEIIKNN